MKNAIYYDPEEQVYIVESNGQEYITKDKRIYEPRPLTTSSGIYNFYVYGAIKYLMDRQYLKSHLDWRTYQGEFFLRLRNEERVVACLTVRFGEENNTFIVENPDIQGTAEYIIDPFLEDDYDGFLCFWDGIIYKWIDDTAGYGDAD